MRRRIQLQRKDRDSSPRPLRENARDRVFRHGRFDIQPFILQLNGFDLVLFTSVAVEPNSEESAQILAPLAVTRDQHGQGIGSRLIQEGHAHLQQSGVELVFVLGYPDYYSRFGFAPAGIRGFQAPCPILPNNADAWMVHELASGAIEQYEGIIRCSKALDHPQYWQE